MKYILVFLLIMSLYIVYLANTNIGFMHIWHNTFPTSNTKALMLQQDLEVISDLNGTYSFSCKYCPEIYEVGVGFRYDELPTSFHKTNPEIGGGYTLKTRILITNKKGKILYGHL